MRLLSEQSEYEEYFLNFYQIRNEPEFEEIMSAMIGRRKKESFFASASETSSEVFPQRIPIRIPTLKKALSDCSNRVKSEFSEFAEHNFLTLLGF